MPTPCGTCPKTAGLKPEQRVRENADEFNDRTRKAYRFYLRCKATGNFPDDDIVAWYSGLIREMEDAVERAEKLAWMKRLGIEVSRG